MKTFKLIIAAFLFSSICNAQNLSKGFKLIDKEKYSEASSFFIENNSNCIAKAGLVKILIKTDKLKSEQELIKAYKSITEVKECYKLVDTKTKDKHVKVLTETDISQFYKTIDNKYFSFVTSKNNTSLYNTYLGICGNSSHYEDVLTKADNLKYSEADKLFSAASYNEYLKSYPNGNHVKAAKDNLTMLRDFSEINSIEKCQMFLSKYENSRLSKEANEKLEELHYEIAKTSNTIESYKYYLSSYPKGKYKTQALNKIELISFNNAKKKNTINSYHYAVKKSNFNHISFIIVKFNKIHNILQE
jgi:outer membrane protein assembly factor BamD (BamD/ComL family)